LAPEFGFRLDRLRRRSEEFGRVSRRCRFGLLEADVGDSVEPERGVNLAARGVHLGLISLLELQDQLFKFAGINYQAEFSFDRQRDAF